MYYPDTAEVPESQAVNIRNRSFVIGAHVDLPDSGAEGVLMAQGSRFGGHALYIKDNRLHYVNNFVGLGEQKVDATEDLPTGRNLLLSASFVKDGEDPPHVSTGILSLYYNDRLVGEGGSGRSPASSRSPAKGSRWDATAARRSLPTTPAPGRGRSPAAPCTGSPWTSAASRTSTWSARPRRC